MSERDPRLDAYIARSAAFARPLLSHLRALVHEACPAAQETIKWGMPTFMHADTILCHMAAFKQHVAFGFWRHALVLDEATKPEGMGSLGKLRGPRDLPSDRQLAAWIRKAARVNEADADQAVARKPPVSRAVPDLPPGLRDAFGLEEHAAARATFEGFPPSGRRDYIEWITGAKRAETRDRRLAQALEWLAEGKPRNWKYIRR